MKRPKRPLCVEIFSGYGGFSLGAEAAGFNLGCAVELDPVLAAVHEFNFPYAAQICQDIQQITANDIFSALTKKGFSKNIVLLLGGSPCQSFSYQGDRQPNDPRGKLIFEFVRMVEELKPQYFIFENVEGLVNGNPYIDYFLPLNEQLLNLGYKICSPFKILNAANFGCPQARKRLFLIGSRKDCSQAQYPLETHGKGLLPYNTVKDAIGDLAKILPFLKDDQGTLATLLDYSGFRENYQLEPSGIFKLCHRRYYSNLVYNHLGTRHGQKTRLRFSQVEQGKRDKVSHFYRLKPDGVSPTLTSGTNRDRGSYSAAKPIHYDQHRVISGREFLRLQGFPDFYRGNRTKWSLCRGTGNAVIPIMAKIICDEIIRALKIDTTQLPILDLPQQDEKLLNFSMSQASSYYQIEDNIIAKRRKRKKAL